MKISYIPIIINESIRKIALYPAFDADNGIRHMLYQKMIQYKITSFNKLDLNKVKDRV